MIDTPAFRYSGKRIVPIQKIELALREPVNLSPSTTFLAGQCLGQVTTSANDVQTATISGTPTAGILVLTFTIDGVTANATLVMAGGVFPTNAVIQAIIRSVSLLTPGTVTVTGTLGGAANGTIILTYTGFYGFRPIPVVIAVVTGLTGGVPAQVVVHTVTGVTAGQFTAYASGNSDGSQIFRAVAEYDMVTDSQGRVTFGQQVGGGFHGETFLTGSVWVAGFFKTDDLIGLDANAVTTVAGRLIVGTVTSGIMQF